MSPTLYGAGESRLRSAVPTASELTLPGLCEVDVSKSLKLDVLVGPGFDNGRVITRGYEPAKVRITFTWWTPNQHEIAMACLALLFQPLGKADPNNPQQGRIPCAYRIRHPATDVRRVSQIVIESINGPKPGKWPTSMAVELSCVEYAKPGKLPVVGEPAIGSEPNDVTGFGGKPPAGTANVNNLPSKTKVPAP